MNSTLRFFVFFLCIIGSFYGSFCQEIKLSEPIRFLALGDSYTIGESVPDSLSWPFQLFTQLGQSGFETDSLKIIARTGWRTDNLLNAIENEEPLDNFNLVSLLIGVNDQYQGAPIANYPDNFETLLQKAISITGNESREVFVLSIPDYAYTPFGQGNSDISTEIDQYNEINAGIAANYGVKCFDITPISREGLVRPELVAADGLHPSGKMYEEWVALIAETIFNNNPPVSTLKSPSSKNLEIFPVPASNILHIKYLPDSETAWKYQLYSSAGKLVKSGLLDQKEINDSFTINITMLPTGLYHLRLYLPGQRVYGESIPIH